MTAINQRPGVIFMSYMVKKYFSLEDLNLSKEDLLAKWVEYLIEDGEVKDGYKIINHPMPRNMDTFTLIYMALRSRIVRVLAHERV
jgi:hypothetical protein